MWRIMTAALKWYTGKYADDTEAKAAIFAAIAEARAAHMPHLPPRPELVEGPVPC